MNEKAFQRRNRILRNGEWLFRKTKERPRVSHFAEQCLFTYLLLLSGSCPYTFSNEQSRLQEKSVLTFNKKERAVVPNSAEQLPYKALTDQNSSYSFAAIKLALLSFSELLKTGSCLLMLCEPNSSPSFPGLACLLADCRNNSSVFL